MARASVSKTRATDKSRPPASQTLAITHEIVPGKFTDSDWNLMINRDGSEEFVAELVDEFIDVAMGAVFKKYLERQLLPFTITQAKDAIVEIIEWYFLERDVGELQISSDPGWTEDEEPESADTDCWAQGSIPKNFVAAPPEIMTEIPELPEEETDVENDLPAVVDMPQEPPELQDAVSDTEEVIIGDLIQSSVEGIDYIILETNQKTKQDSKSTIVSNERGTKERLSLKKMHSDTVESSENPAFSHHLHDSAAHVNKTKSCHVSAAKDVLFDEMGNVLAIPKLDPEKLPTHKVNVKFVVLDYPNDSSLMKVDLKKKQISGNKQKSKHQDVPDTSSKAEFQGPSALPAAQSSKSRSTTKNFKNSVKGMPGGNPLESALSIHDAEHSRRPSLYEEIEVSQGITIKERGHVKKGPCRYYRKLDILDTINKGMKPVNLRIAEPGITVADLLDRQSPILRPYGDLSPLPPIVPPHLRPNKQSLK